MKRDPCVKFSQQAKLIKVSVAKCALEHGNGVPAALHHDVGYCQVHTNNHVIESWLLTVCFKTSHPQKFIREKFHKDISVKILSLENF